MGHLDGLDSLVYSGAAGTARIGSGAPVNRMARAGTGTPTTPGERSPDAPPVNPKHPASMAAQPPPVRAAGLHVVTVQPPWPAPEYQLACPNGTTAAECLQLGGSKGCFEPERETAEVVTALLLGSAPSALYVDVGCNVGAFAAQAAALGAAVDCYEPTPFHVTSIRASNHRTGRARGAVARAPSCGGTPHGLKQGRPTHEILIHLRTVWRG